MKNGKETRPNGVVIAKKQTSWGALYHVEGSKNGPWTYLRNARRDADLRLFVAREEQGAAFFVVSPVQAALIPKELKNETALGDFMLLGNDKERAALSVLFGDVSDCYDWFIFEVLGE
jgi:hypothetical protein